MSSPKEIRDSVDGIVHRFLEDLKAIEKREGVEITIREVEIIPPTSPGSFSNQDPQPERRMVKGTLYETGVEDTETAITF